MVPKQQEERFQLTNKGEVFFIWGFFCFVLVFWFFLVFLGLHLRQMEVPRLGVESEPQLPTYTTATAMPGLSRICNLHHSSLQCQIFNPLSEARD